MRIKLEFCKRRPALFRRSLVLFIFLCLSFGQAFAMQYWGEGLFCDFGFSSKKSVPDSVPLEASLGIRKMFTRSGIFAAVCVDNFAMDSSMCLSAFPLSRERFRLGVSYLAHLSTSFPADDSPNLLVWDNSFKVSALFKSKNAVNPFRTVIELGINVKNTKQKLTNNTLRLEEAFPVLSVQFAKCFGQRHEVLFRLATFDALYFRGFLNTWWQLGYAYDISSKFTTGALLEVMYADQTTLSGMISGFQGKLFLAYKL